MRYSVLTNPEFDFFLSPLLMKNHFYVWIDGEYHSIQRDDGFSPLPITGDMEVWWRRDDDDVTPQLSFPEFELRFSDNTFLTWQSLEMGVIAEQRKIPARLLLYRGKYHEDEAIIQYAYKDEREEEKVPAGYLLLGNLTLELIEGSTQYFSWQCTHITTNFGGKLCDKINLPLHDSDLD